MNRFLEGIRVLVVEDDEDNLELLEFLLREHGASPATARTAAEARALLRSMPPDVIVCDLMLPDEDGCAFLSSVRANAATAHIPAIALTAQVEDVALLRAAKAGFARHIAKPADLLVVLSAVGSLVNREDGQIHQAHVPGRAAERSLRERIASLIARADVSGLLALLNGETSFRFTSLCRLDAGTVVTLATFDRQSPDAGTNALLDGPPAPPYCEFVERLRAPFVLANAERDPRVASHPMRDKVAAYCGVPLMRDDRSLFGALCHFDLEPKPAGERTVSLLEGAARMLRSELAGYEAIDKWR